MSRPDEMKEVDAAQPAAEPSMAERLGALAQQLRAYTDSAALSFVAMKGGGVGLHGATSAALEASLAGIRDLVDRGLSDALLRAGGQPRRSVISLVAFIDELRLAAHFDAQMHGCELLVGTVPPDLRIEGHRPMLNAAISILLQNAFRFTHPGSTVTLCVRRIANRILIEVEDACGGFPAGRDGLHSREHHGLLIVRRAIEANEGTLVLRNAPGLGCTMSIDLPAS